MAYETVAPGSRVRVRLGNGSSADAELLRLRKDGTADVSLIHLGKEMQIHSSSRDDSGLKTDSWRPIRGSQVATEAQPKFAQTAPAAEQQNAAAPAGAIPEAQSGQPAVAPAPSA
jgi:hypothetical protein